MFDNLTDRLSNSFKALQGKNKLSESNIKEAIREVRRSLLEADVALDVIKHFIDRVQAKAIGLKVGEGLSPSQAFIKLVETELTEVIGGQNESLNLATQPPAVVMVAGLQGSGKTTSIAKLARFLKQEQKKKILVVSADVYRPAAIEQLKVLASEIEVDFFPSNADEKPEKNVSYSKKHAKSQFHDFLLLLNMSFQFICYHSFFDKLFKNSNHRITMKCFISYRPSNYLTHSFHFIVSWKIQ